MAVSVGRNRMALGLAGFLLGCGVVAVPVALLRSDLSGIGNGSDETLRTLAYLAILPAIAVLLLITIGTAVLARKLPGLRNKMHVFNHAVFIVGVIHGLAIGAQGTILAVGIIFTAYAAPPHWRASFTGLASPSGGGGWSRRAAAGAILFCIIVTGLVFAIPGGQFADAFGTAKDALDFLARLAGLLAAATARL